MIENLSSIKCRNILIVEDEQDIRENLKMLLELEGYKVFTAVNGEDGLKVLRTMERPCLILLDLLMPVMNGMEFLKEKRHEDTIAQIPVCIVSGVAEKPDMKGVSGFVKKPIDLDVLLKFIKSHCHPI
jgi:DNA-binding response OmpR family regulator